MIECYRNSNENTKYYFERFIIRKDELSDEDKKEFRKLMVFSFIDNLNQSIERGDSVGDIRNLTKQAIEDIKAYEDFENKDNLINQLEEFLKFLAWQRLKSPDYRFGQAFLNYFPDISYLMRHDGDLGASDELKLFNEINDLAAQKSIEKWLDH